MSELNFSWRKSSYSGTNNECVEVGATWRKSSYSGSVNECVEVARTPARVGVRDSKDPHSGVLVLSPTEWQAFVSGAKAGEFDLA